MLRQQTNLSPQLTFSFPCQPAKNVCNDTQKRWHELENVLAQSFFIQPACFVLRQRVFIVTNADIVGRFTCWLP